MINTGEYHPPVFTAVVTSVQSKPTEHVRKKSIVSFRRCQLNDLKVNYTAQNYEVGLWSGNKKPGSQ